VSLTGVHFSQACISQGPSHRRASHRACISHRRVSHRRASSRGHLIGVSLIDVSLIGCQSWSANVHENEREYYRRRCDYRRHAAHSQARLSVFPESPVNFRAVRLRGRWSPSADAQSRSRWTQGCLCRREAPVVEACRIILTTEGHSSKGIASC
jgi:hypothetical protein